MTYVLACIYCMWLRLPFQWHLGTQILTLIKQNNPKVWDYYGGTYGSCTHLKGFADLRVTAPPTRRAPYYIMLAHLLFTKSVLSTIILQVHKTPMVRSYIHIHWWRLRETQIVVDARLPIPPLRQYVQGRHKTPMVRSHNSYALVAKLVDASAWGAGDHCDRGSSSLLQCTKKRFFGKLSPTRAIFSLVARSANQMFSWGEMGRCHACGVVFCFLGWHSRHAPRCATIESGKQFKAYAVLCLNGYFATIWRMLNCFPSGVAF